MSNPDFIHITKSGAEVSRKFLADDIEEGGVHVDAIQLIPHGGYAGYINRPWYAAAEIRSVSISDCSITSKGTLQGITGFDGLFSDISIDRCVFYLSSAHKVTFNGLLSGSFTNMYSGEYQHGVSKPSAPLHEDTKCIVRLNNLRIGGAPVHEGVIKQLHVISFSDSRTSYRTVDFDGTVSILDTRGLPVRSTMRSQSTQQLIVNMANFDLELFRSRIEDIQRELAFLSVAEVCVAYQRVALGCGDIIR